MASLRVAVVLFFAEAAYCARVGESDLTSPELDMWTPWSSPDPAAEHDKKLKASIAACAADPKKALKNEVCDDRRNPSDKKECCFKSLKCTLDDNMQTSSCRDINWKAAHNQADADRRAAQVQAFNAKQRESQNSGVFDDAWGVSGAAAAHRKRDHVRNQPEMEAAEYKNRMDRGFYKAVHDGGYMGSKPTGVQDDKPERTMRHGIIVNGHGY